MLSRIGLSDSEAERFSHQFSTIIDYFHILNQVDTDDIPPATDLCRCFNVLRDDVVRLSIPAADVTNRAPRETDGYVRVGTVIEGQNIV